ncbi:MAG: hypothetical protein DRI34_07645 [Deltaproteobacteria bacterium]|nr:MAG: hypothetical protein DRI34_07645 [Deltaproteobacteria bacterium]
MAGKAAKRRALDEEGGDNTFVVMFTALMMILLAFFILLSTLAHIDQRRKRLALGSLMGSFGILPGGVGMDREGEYSLNTNPIMPGVRREAFMRALGSLFSGETAGGKVDISMRRGRVVLSFRSDILFPRGVAEVSPRAFALLDEVAVVVLTLGEPVRIEGHSDASGGPAAMSNWRLSLERAVAVARYLHQGGHVPQKLLSVAGYAATRADAARGIEPERQRRVEIVFTNQLGV